MNPTRPRRPRVTLNRNGVSELLSLLNISQTQLAWLCGLSPGYFSLLMAGKRSPSPDARRRIQEALGVSDFDGCSSRNPLADSGSAGRERLRPAVHRGTRWPRKAMTRRRLPSEMQEGPHTWANSGGVRQCTAVPSVLRSSVPR